VWGQSPRLVRSISGPSGKVVGSQFIFDEVRSRFVHPQDRSLTVYFEWETEPGDHVLTAIWKQPDGRVATVSPDVKIQTTTPTLNSYWIFTIEPTNPAGAWTVEIRMDGQPAGSHTFELAGVDPSGGRMTLDQVFKSYSGAIVRIHKLDDTGRRLDIGSGFVAGPNLVVTAFQIIDSATSLEVEFPDGRRVSTTDVAGLSRLGDWAVVRVDTGSVAPIPTGGGQILPVGARVALFDEAGDTRIVQPFDVSAVTTLTGYGGRIRLSPSVSAVGIGGPVIDERGMVVGVVGGSLMPGVRAGLRAVAQYPELQRTRTANSATPIVDVALGGTNTKSLATLQSEGLLTPALSPMPEMLLGGTAPEIPKDASDRRIRDVSEFSSREHTELIVYAFWIKRAKLSKGELSASVFDATNQRRGTIAPRKVTLKGTEQRFSFALPLRDFSPGYYRIDLYWDNTPVWRTHVRVVD
jgi:hypothetical protein